MTFYNYIFFHFLCVCILRNLLYDYVTRTKWLNKQDIVFCPWRERYAAVAGAKNVIWWQGNATCTGSVLICFRTDFPGSRVHGANMGPIWDRQDPGGPHVCPMNFAIWVISSLNDDVIKWTHFSGPLCGEFIGQRRIPLTKVSDAELWRFSLICA